MSIAYEPARVGRYTTRNRVVMAPMTRNRASGPGNSPTELMAAYSVSYTHLTLPTICSV